VSDYGPAPSSLSGSRSCVIAPRPQPLLLRNVSTAAPLRTNDAPVAPKGVEIGLGLGSGVGWTTSKSGPQSRATPPAGILQVGGAETPLSQTEARSVVAEPHPVSAALSSFLVAEDEDLVRRLVSRLLGDQGYRILEAREGGEALRMAHSARPHLASRGGRCGDAWDGRVGTWPAPRDRLSRSPSALHVGVPPRGHLSSRRVEPIRSLLQKPFAPEVFVKTVRELLERADTVPKGSSTVSAPSPLE